MTVRAQVVSLHDGDFLYKVGPAANLATTLGPTAVLRVGAVRVHHYISSAQNRWQSVQLGCVKRQITDVGPVVEHHIHSESPAD